MSELPILPLAAGVLAAAFAGCGGSAAPAPQHPKLVSDDAPTAHHAAAPDVGDRGDEGGMQVSGLHGRLDQYDIQQGVRPHADAINHCYYDHVGGLRYVGGQVQLAFTIARNGTVEKVRIASSDLGAWPVETCLLAVARGMTFTPPTGGGAATFSLPLDFGGGRAITTWNEARADIEIHNNPALDAWRKRRRYRRRHNRHHHRHRRHHAVVDPRPKTKLQKLASCVRDGDGPAPSGATITLYIGRGGAVTSVGFAPDDGAHIDPAWADCATQQIETWKLTTPVSGVAKMSFHYPVTG